MKIENDRIRHTKNVVKGKMERQIKFVSLFDDFSARKDKKQKKIYIYIGCFKLASEALI